MGQLFGVVPRPARPPRTGYALRALRSFPAFSILATFAQSRASEEDLERRIDWTPPLYPGDNALVSYKNDNASFSYIKFPYLTRLDSLNQGPRELSALNSNIPATRHNVNTAIFDNLCYRDLADFARDARLDLDDPVARINSNPGQCQDQAVQFPIDDDGRLDDENTPAIQAAGTPMAALTPEQIRSRTNSTKSLRNKWCWEPLAGESVNAAVRLVRFRYFPPRRDRLQVAPLNQDAQGTQPGWIYRLALYSLMDINVANGGAAGAGTEIFYDTDSSLIAKSYCPVPGDPMRRCIDEKKLKQFVPLPGE